ncbi:MAG: amidohydrolase [Proteobacteria bacterium]|nr:amidohydrolase [Pseudomonadota bacterium]
MIIDLHTHILPPGWPEMGAASGYGGWPCLCMRGDEHADIIIDGRLFRSVERNCFDVDRRIAECDRLGVDVQVLSTVPVMFSYWAQPRDALALARHLNDHIAECVRARPDRFVGLGTVPLQDPDLAIAEMERCMTELGMRGIEIGTHVNDWNLDDPALFPFFERAAALGAALFVHPWDMVGKERMPRYFLPWLVGMPAETSLAICSLIFGGVLDRLPGLRVCFAHGGGSFPMTLGRIDHAFEARPDLTQVSTQRRPRDQARQIYLDALVHDAAVLRYLVEQFGSDRVALGSDYPFPLGETRPGELIISCAFAPEVEADLLGRTAARFLGLTPKGKP